MKKIFALLIALMMVFSLVACESDDGNSGTSNNNGLVNDDLEDAMDKLEELNVYLIKTFRLAFGNRIMKQIKDYVPCFIGCGGTEIQAVVSACKECAEEEGNKAYRVAYCKLKSDSCPKPPSALYLRVHSTDSREARRSEQVEHKISESRDL